ncbi:MAG: co-chaperone GroES [Betaproteobacteria bacterium]|nr:MAG: co-chaperone GroES [Betaproteobacteria bacterium]
MNLIPKGDHILVKLVEVEEKSAGGIIMGTPNELNREQAGQFIAKVEEIGPFAFSEWEWDDLDDTLQARCNNYGVNVGDTVVFHRYDGLQIALDEYKNHRLIPSNCIIGKLEK